MKALRFDRFGSLDALRVTEVPPSRPCDTEVLVRVRAAGGVLVGPNPLLYDVEACAEMLQPVMEAFDSDEIPPPKAVSEVSLDQGPEVYRRSMPGAPRSSCSLCPDGARRGARYWARLTARRSATLRAKITTQSTADATHQLQIAWITNSSR